MNPVTYGDSAMPEANSLEPASHASHSAAYGAPDSSPSPMPSHSSKKRGRKPKGGKIIPNIGQNVSDDTYPLENIILHLKCTKKDVATAVAAAVSMEGGAYGENVPHATHTECGAGPLTSGHTKNNNLLESFYTHRNACLAQDARYNSTYCAEMPNDSVAHGATTELSFSSDMAPFVSTYTTETNEYLPEGGTADDNYQPVPEMNRVHEKIRELQYNFRNNVTYKTHSDCFWCTCAFDSPAVCIPISVNSEGVYRVYGHFCMPECALAYLMHEHLDSSTKYERSALLHSLYRDTYKYTHAAFKPAPAPHYILNKYCGNMSIEEYRSLYKNHKYLMVLNKPISKVYPEIHEDNSDFVMKTKTIPTHSEKGEGYGKGGIHSLLSNFVILN